MSGSAYWSFGEIMKHIKKIIVVLLCLTFFVLTGCNPPEIEKPQAYGKTLPIAVDTDLFIEECFLYSGEFVEDASFEEKTDVAAIKVKNNSDKDVQLARIFVTTTEKELFFEITTLPAGGVVTVLEKNGQTLVENEGFTDFRVENRVDFQVPLTMHEDHFLVQANDKTINIKNVSEIDIESDIYVYYKKKDADGNYFGGITFRTKADGLKPDEIKQLPASNFLKADSEVMFVDYAS